MTSWNHDHGGATRSVWLDRALAVECPPLTGDERTGVCVVGAGISGLTAAYLLAKAGKRVIVLDEKPVGGGETGRTSAHLASAMDDRFQHLERVHGAESVRLQHQSHCAAIDLIE